MEKRFLSFNIITHNFLAYFRFIDLANQIGKKFVRLLIIQFSPFVEFLF